MARPRAVMAALAWLAWIPGSMALACGLSWLAGASRAGARLAVALGALALLLPLLIRDAPVLRAAVSLYLLWSWFKVIGITRDPVRRSGSFRALSALVIHDLRRDGFVRTGPKRDVRLSLILGALGAGALALLALQVALFEATAWPSPAGLLLRHAAGVVFAYFGVEAMLRLFEFVYRSVGLQPPVFHDHPILSRSLAEFWGRRWNRVVGGWLFSTFYRPFAARGKRALGTVAAFGASALLHLYFTWAAVGLGWGLCMAAFFVLQAPLLWLEERVQERAWPSALQRAWTAGWMAVTSPLFIEPLLAIMQSGFTSS